MLIDRSNHLCQADPNFERNFKTRYAAQDPKLFDNPVLNLLFENEKQLEGAKQDFVIDVSKTLDLTVIAKAKAATQRCGGSITSGENSKLNTAD